MTIDRAKALSIVESITQLAMLVGLEPGYLILIKTPSGTVRLREDGSVDIFSGASALFSGGEVAPVAGAVETLALIEKHIARAYSRHVLSED